MKKMAMPTNGNAGAALAAYASRAGIETVVFCPDDTPQVNMDEIALQGARLYKGQRPHQRLRKSSSARARKQPAGSILRR